MDRTGQDTKGKERGWEPILRRSSSTKAVPGFGARADE